MSGYLSDKEYNFIYSKSTRVCIDILLVKAGEVFLIKRDIEPYKGKWHLPGGRIRFRESISAAINRIAKDEMGIRVYVPKLLGFMEFPREVQKGNKRHSVSLVFLVSVNQVPKNGSFFESLPTNTHPVNRRFLIRNNILCKSKESQSY